MLSTWIVFLGLCIYGTQCGEFASDEFLSDRELVRAIFEDSQRIKRENSAQSAKDWTRKEVCFDEIGCFNKENGPFHYVSNMPESPEKIQSTFSLFTSSNPDKPKMLSYKDKTTLSTSVFDPDLPLAVISHGLTENGGKPWIANMRLSLLNQGYGGVIVVDWGKGAAMPYGQAMVNSEVVGRQVAYILELLQKARGLRMEAVHLLGYSLGAHLSGFIGKSVFNKLGEKVGRITGLDPAGPSFEDRTPKTHLSSNDALYVDVIHTSAGGSILTGDLGIVKPIGHADYYPNGGSNQPGCGFFEITCSHGRGNLLFLESMSSSSSCLFTGFPCSGGYNDYVSGKCKVCSGNGCGNLGINSYLSSGRGRLYLRTNQSAPYCKKP